MKENIAAVHKSAKAASCCALGNPICKVRPVITADDRGQLVLPKEWRDKANIRAGDNFVLFTWEGSSEVCRLSPIRSEHSMERVADFILHNRIWRQEGSSGSQR